MQSRNLQFVPGFCENTEKFEIVVTQINKNGGSVTLYEDIKMALYYYSLLDSESKESVKESYATLCGYIEEYNLICEALEKSRPKPVAAAVVVIGASTL